MDEGECADWLARATSRPRGLADARPLALVDAILTRPGSLFELTTFQHPCGATVKNYKNVRTALLLCLPCRSSLTRPVPAQPPSLHRSPAQQVPQQHPPQLVKRRPRPPKTNLQTNARPGHPARRLAAKQGRRRRHARRARWRKLKPMGHQLDCVALPWRGAGLCEHHAHARGEYPLSCAC